MASSSSQCNATRAPPLPDQLASFRSLLDKVVNAGVLCRHARAAELSSKAAEKGEALFGDNSLVVAHLRMGESMALASLAMTMRGAEKDALQHRSVSALLLLIAILQRRLVDNTLLPGSVRKDEADYYVHTLSGTLSAREQHVPPPAVLHCMAPTFGYEVLIDALYKGLNFLHTMF